MAKKLNLKESRVIISSQRSLTACRPLGFVGRSMAAIVGPRARGGSYGVGTYPSLHHRDRGPRAAATVKRDVVWMAFNAARIWLSRRLMIDRRAFEMMM